MPLVNGRTRKRSAAGGWSEAEVCAEEFPLRWGPCMEYNAAASGSSCAQREEAGIGKQRCAAGRSRQAEAGRQKPAGVQLFCVAAVVPTVGAELAFWQAYGGYKVFQSLELERCELHVFAHYVYHLFVLCAVAVHILLKYLL